MKKLILAAIAAFTFTAVSAQNAPAPEQAKPEAKKEMKKSKGHDHAKGDMKKEDHKADMNAGAEKPEGAKKKKGHGRKGHKGHKAEDVKTEAPAQKQ